MLHALRLLGLAILGFAAGCRYDPVIPPPRGAGAAARIVCGSPAVSELVFALGCGDRVVGVSDYTIYPPEAAALPTIGGWINPSRERLLTLKPDLIITQGTHATLAAFAKRYAIDFLSLAPNSLASIDASIERIAARLEVEAAGARLRDQLRSDIERLRARLDDAPRRRVALLVGHTPGDLTGLTTVGANTFLEELIDVAGGTNVFSDVKGMYPQISKETLLARDPELIIEVSPGTSARTAERMQQDWSQLEALPDSAQRRVIVLTEDYLLIPGPRIAQVAECLARAIHVERFGG